MSMFLRYPSKDRESGDGPGAYEPGVRVANAVNAALACRQPLLVMGEPGVGKTDLAYSVGWHLGWPVEKYVVRSDSRGRDVLYSFDHLQRLYDAQMLGSAADKIKSQTLDSARDRFDRPELYVSYRALGKALVADTPTVVLVDEVDKAPWDFPNDLLNELDKQDLRVDEIDQPKPRKDVERLVVFTSNDERALPAPFLRRCVFVRIPFPTRKELDRIVELRTNRKTIAGNAVTPALAKAATQRFLDTRNTVGDIAQWYKPPSISELLRWIDVLTADGKRPDQVHGPDQLQLEELHPGVVVKTMGDATLVGLDV